MKLQTKPGLLQYVMLSVSTPDVCKCSRPSAPLDNCLKSPDYKTQYRNSRLWRCWALQRWQKTKLGVRLIRGLHTSCRAKQSQHKGGAWRGLCCSKTSVSVFKLLKRWDNISLICKHSEHLNTKCVLPASSDMFRVFPVRSLLSISPPSVSK